LKGRGRRGGSFFRKKSKSVARARKKSCPDSRDRSEGGKRINQLEEGRKKIFDHSEKSYSAPAYPYPEIEKDLPGKGNSEEEEGVPVELSERPENH